jgi:hypothetical protein
MRQATGIPLTRSHLLRRVRVPGVPQRLITDALVGQAIPGRAGYDRLEVAPLDEIQG